VDRRTTPLVDRRTAEATELGSRAQTETIRPAEPSVFAGLVLLEIVRD